MKRASAKSEDNDGEGKENENENENEGGDEGKKPAAQFFCVHLPLMNRGGTRNISRVKQGSSQGEAERRKWPRSCRVRDEVSQTGEHVR